MTRTASLFALAWRALAALVAALGLAAPAAAQQAASAPAPSRFAESAAPQRAAMIDNDIVWRAPTVDTLATVRRRGVLRIGVVVGEPMVHHDAKGELVGYAIDIGNRLGEDLGVRVAFVETSWDAVIPDLIDRRIDLIAADLWATPQRALVVNFTEPIAVEGIHLVAARKPGPERKTVADFNKPGVRIAVYGDTVQERVTARIFPKATLVRLQGDDSSVAPLRDNKADAVVVPLIEPGLLLVNAPDNVYLPFDRPLSANMSALAVRKGDPDFLTYLNTWLAMQRHAGWLGDRMRHWLESSD